MASEMSYEDKHFWCQISVTIIYGIPAEIVGVYNDRISFVYNTR